MKKELEIAELVDYSPNTIVIENEVLEEQFQEMSSADQEQANEG